MSKFGSFLCGLLLIVTATISLAILGAYYAFEVLDRGVLYLPHANGPVTILRETETGIIHVRADDWLGLAYGQGFASAQSRLWQMERNRRLASGTLSELFGKDALLIDEFFRYVGLARVTKQTIAEGGIDPETVKLLQAYSDGVNDYVAGVSLLSSGQKTARALPIEFLTFGITAENFNPWTPED